MKTSGMLSLSYQSIHVCCQSILYLSCQTHNHIHRHQTSYQAVHLMESRYGRRIRSVHVLDTACGTAALVQLIVTHPAITDYRKKIRVVFPLSFRLPCGYIPLCKSLHRFSTSGVGGPRYGEFRSSSKMRTSYSLLTWTSKYAESRS